jgi:Tfp pilus assembly protein PilO
MTSFLDKLNLRPQERRLVVGVIIVVFIILNVWLVWPHFGDWGRFKGDLEKAHENLRKYSAKIAQVEGPNGFRARLKKLEGEGEQNIVADEQEIQLLRTVQNQVQQSKIMVSGYSPVTRSSSGQSTNEFFEEQSIKITVNTGEKELVDFLLNIGAGGSMIRVRDLDLRPADQNRYRLQGSITLSANYQKKSAAKPAAAVAKPAAPAVKSSPAGAKKS